MDYQDTMVLPTLTLTVRFKRWRPINLHPITIRNRLLEYQDQAETLIKINL